MKKKIRGLENKVQDLEKRMTAPRFNLFPEGVKETNDDCVPEYSQEDEKLRMHKVKRKSLHCQQAQSEIVLSKKTNNTHKRMKKLRMHKVLKK